MAISTQRSLSELKKECAVLGLEVTQSGSRESKTDYILALRAHYLRTLYPNGVPSYLERMLTIESPMLAAQSKHIPEAEMEKIWNSDEWVAQEKIDGCRSISFWSQKEGFHMFSRNISVKTYLPVDYSDNVYLPNLDLSKIVDEFTLDAEIESSNPNICTVMGNKGVVTGSQLNACTALLAMNTEDSIRIQKEENCPLRFKGFDVLWFNGKSVMDLPYIERAKILKKVVAQLQEAGVPITIPTGVWKNKKQFYKVMLAQGKEGVVLKNLKAPYYATTSRSHKAWLKVKRTLAQASGMEGLCDTIDAWVSGYEPADENKSWAGLIGALIFSVTVRRADGTTYEHPIAKISNIDLELRKKMTEVVNGVPTLKNEYYGKVASVDGQAISAREKRLKHAVLVEWRPDRSVDSCILDEEFIESQIL